MILVSKEKEDIAAERTCKCWRIITYRYIIVKENISRIMGYIMNNKNIWTYSPP